MKSTFMFASLVASGLLAGMLSACGSADADGAQASSQDQADQSDSHAGTDSEQLRIRFPWRWRGSAGSAGSGAAGSGAAGSGAAGSGAAGSGAAGSGAAGSGAAGSGAAGSHASGNQLFPSDSPWYKDVSGMDPHPNSGRITNWLANNGGWGFGRLQIDYSMEVLQADSSTPTVSWTPTSDWFAPDCDLDPLPVPEGGALEAESNYECTGDGDCHLLVVNKSTGKLYEMWRANRNWGNWQGGCLSVWDTTRTYPETGRGEQCTSADAAGFPITPLLFNADEVASGHIDHAIRFILPNDRIRHMVYVRPATHSTNATSGGTDAPPYGVRFRLRANYPVESLPTEGARVVARALQKYGMLLADAGQIALSAQSDRLTTAKWDGLLGSRDLQSIQVGDFEVVDMGESFVSTNDCSRN